MPRLLFYICAAALCVMAYTTTMVSAFHLPKSATASALQPQGMMFRRDNTLMTHYQHKLPKQPQNQAEADQLGLFALEDDAEKTVYGRYVFLENHVSHEDVASLSKLQLKTITVNHKPLSKAYESLSQRYPSLIAHTSKVKGGGCGKDLCKTEGEWQKRCIDTQCDPLCVQTTWKAELEGTGSDEFNNDFNEDPVKLAVQGVILGAGCIQMGCCEKEQIIRWVESKINGQKAGGSLIPIKFCRELQTRDDACSGCGVSISLSPVEGECDRHFKPEAPDAAPFTRAKGPPGAQQIPAHKSWKERCDKVTTTFTGAQGGIKSDADSWVCGCVGCCDDQKCPFQVAFSNVEAALKG